MNVPCNALCDGHANTSKISDKNDKTQIKFYVHTIENIVLNMYDKQYQYALCSLLIMRHFVFKRQMSRVHILIDAYFLLL